MSEGHGHGGHEAHGGGREAHGHESKDSYVGKMVEKLRKKLSVTSLLNKVFRSFPLKNTPLGWLWNYESGWSPDNHGKGHGGGHGDAHGGDHGGGHH